MWRGDGFDLGSIEMVTHCEQGHFCLKRHLTHHNTSFTWRCILHSIIYMQKSILSRKVKDCSCPSPLYRSREPCHWGTQEGSLYQWCYFESSVTFLLWLHCPMHTQKFRAWGSMSLSFFWHFRMALSLQKTIDYSIFFLNPERQIFFSLHKEAVRFREDGRIFFWGGEKMPFE